jgi:hypothetical protein
LREGAGWECWGEVKVRLEVVLSILGATVKARGVGIIEICECIVKTSRMRIEKTRGFECVRGPRLVARFLG